MTVHKAKGLQNKIIIIANAGWSLDPDGSKNMIWASSDEPPLNNYSEYLVQSKSALMDTYFSNDYCREGILSNIDNLNLIYVALTRAEHHLYVIFPYKFSKKEIKEGRNSDKADSVIKTTTDLFIKILRDKVLIAEEPDSEIDFGECKNFKTPDEISGAAAQEQQSKTVYIKHTKSKQGFIGLNNIIIHPRQKTLKLIKDREFIDKTNFGELVHETLYRIKDPDEIDKTIKELEAEGFVNEFNREQLIEKVNSVLSDIKVKEWFKKDWEVKAEAEILMPDGKIIRPDRVIIKDNKAIIIDWKTGIHKDEHFEQVRKYADALKDNGYEIEAIYIYNFLENKILINEKVFK
jgi:ATP-dependent exoDNAse (exonuclease V) beta subunit